MAITKEANVSKIEVVGGWNIQVRTDTIIKEDGTEISRSIHRHILVPYSSTKDGDTRTQKATDKSSEVTEVQAIANAAWTDTVKANYKTFVESQTV